MTLALWKQVLPIGKPAVMRAVVALLAGIVLALLLSDRAVAAAASETLTAARFAITIDGYEIASFSELETITTAVEVTTHTEGTGGGVVIRKLPGALSSTIILRRAMTRSLEMSAWHELVILGDIAAARKNVTITAYANDGKSIARYHLTAAWPSKIEIGALKAGSSEVLMETVTMTCEFVQRVAI